MRSIGNRSEQTIRNWKGGVLGREGVKEEYNIGVIQLGSNTNFFPFMCLFSLFKKTCDPQKCSEIMNNRI